MKTQNINKKAAYVKWARWARNVFFDNFKTTLRCANTPNLEVIIEKTSDKSPVEWTIMPESDPSFWLEKCKTKKAAVAFCKEMGWVVVE